MNPTVLPTYETYEQRAFDEAFNTLVGNESFTTMSGELDLNAPLTIGIGHVATSGELETHNEDNGVISGQLTAEAMQRINDQYAFATHEQRMQEARLYHEQQDKDDEDTDTDSAKPHELIAV